MDLHVSAGAQGYQSYGHKQRVKKDVEQSGLHLVPIWDIPREYELIKHI